MSTSKHGPSKSRPVARRSTPDAWLPKASTSPTPDPEAWIGRPEEDKRLRAARWLRAALRHDRRIPGAVVTWSCKPAEGYATLQAQAEPPALRPPKTWYNKLYTHGRKPRSGPKKKPEEKCAGTDAASPGPSPQEDAWPWMGWVVLGSRR